jgi:hypothetical protein
VQGKNVDDNDKIRRNLVVFSSATIYASFVGISVKEQSISFFTDSLKIRLPTPNVLWISAFILLIYFFARLLQSEEFKKDFNNTITSFQKFWFHRLLQLFNSELQSGKIQSFIDTEDFPASPGSTTNLEDIAKLINEIQNPKLKIMSVSAFEIFPDFGVTPLRILLSAKFETDINLAQVRSQLQGSLIGAKINSDFQFEAQKNGKTYYRIIFEYNRNIAAKLTHSRRFILLVKSGFDITKKTNFATMYAIPFLLGIISISAVIFRITLV